MKKILSLHPLLFAFDDCVEIVNELFQKPFHITLNSIIVFMQYNAIDRKKSRVQYNF